MDTTTHTVQSDLHIRSQLADLHNQPIGIHLEPGDCNEPTGVWRAAAAIACGRLVVVLANLIPPCDPKSRQAIKDLGHLLRGAFGDIAAKIDERFGSVDPYRSAELLLPVVQAMREADSKLADSIEQFRLLSEGLRDLEEHLKASPEALELVRRRIASLKSIVLGGDA